ncbi:hypothetical protein ONE63_006704 [Megalurothrips usitatus]|uniref:Uncharacterized protein n=1 Tax=Megalurothrips usitatus TaxID=439358 RepID=A0AAV7XXF5_9NEOP|nr:hypothetical protein ONE63_006704 [Megalurothrips usitatus]
MDFAIVANLRSKELSVVPTKDILVLEPGFKYRTFAPKSSIDFKKRTFYGVVEKDGAGGRQVSKVWLLRLSGRNEIGKEKMPTLPTHLTSSATVPYKEYTRVQETEMGRAKSRKKKQNLGQAMQEGIVNALKVKENAPSAENEKRMERPSSSNAKPTSQTDEAKGAGCVGETPSMV